MGRFNSFRKFLPAVGYRFKRPLVLFQSDDWGFVGIRDQEGFQELQGRGLSLGTNPYDYYSVETEEDLHCLYEVLHRHHDSIGRSPCFVFNFVMANLNFPRVINSGYARLALMPLAEGLPGKWNRPGFLETYQEGIQQGFIYPAFHGLTHFSQAAALKALQANDERSDLLRKLYEAHTPLLYGQMPWIGFEYHAPQSNGLTGWLDPASQNRLIQEGVNLFRELFHQQPVSACAPGYRANEYTRKGWAANGIQIVQNGPGLPLAPHFDSNGLLCLYRNLSFEPALNPDQDEHFAMKKAEEAFSCGKPIIVCMHSVNFHSTIRNQRDLSLRRLDNFLMRLEKRFKDLLYIHDEDLLQIIKMGELRWSGVEQRIKIRRKLQPSSSLMAHWIQKKEKIY
jgi:hypothetical protein